MSALSHCHSTARVVLNSRPTRTSSKRGLTTTAAPGQPEPSALAGRTKSRSILPTPTTSCSTTRTTSVRSVTTRFIPESSAFRSTPATDRRWHALLAFPECVREWPERRVHASGSQGGHYAGGICLLGWFAFLSGRLCFPGSWLFQRQPAGICRTLVGVLSVSNPDTVFDRLTRTTTTTIFFPQPARISSRALWGFQAASDTSQTRTRTPWTSPTISFRWTSQASSKRCTCSLHFQH